MPASLYPMTERQARFMGLAQDLARKFRAHAAEYDRSGEFPFAHYDEIRASGLPKLVVPEAYGGWGAGLLETVLTIETLGQGDGSTALSVTMHMQTVGSAAEARSWPEPLFAQLCRDAVEKNALINFVATEPEMGSPSRGGRPKTVAHPVAAENGHPEGFRLNGRKNFASMSPALDYMVVLAALEDGSDGVAHFVVTPDDGVEIIETWDAMGMRSTGSHDIQFSDIFVPASRMIPPAAPAAGGQKRYSAWFPLCVSAAYVGVAAAALAAAAQYAQERVPTGLGKPIAEVETIQRRLGEAELLLHQARMHLCTTADLWDRFPEKRDDLVESIIAAKYTATNNAVAVVDQCMRIAGGASMSRSLPLERFYRDVRGGLSHPLNDDLALLRLGQTVLARHELAPADTPENAPEDAPAQPSA